MNTWVKRGALAAWFLSAGLAACQDLPTDAAPEAEAAAFAMGAERLVEEAFYDVTDSYLMFPCDAEGEPVEEGELVRMEGGIFERFTVVFAPSGNIHATWHTMPVGLRGVGVDSGEPFRVKEAQHSNSVMTQTGHTASYRSVLTLVGTETGRRAAMRFAGTFRVTAQNEIIVDRETERLECSGARGMD